MGDNLREGLTGLRRIAWIRVLRGDGDLRAEAVGHGHRLPRVMPIALTTATRLASEGVPLVVHDRRSGAPTQAPGDAVRGATGSGGR